ncbi:hypothetical protein BC332_12562 [Capsicum chinense]|nr:hypothetical protein BC332_12562 [Capsicum chinense]
MYLAAKTTSFWRAPDLLFHQLVAMLSTSSPCSAGQYYLVSETPYILGARSSAVTRLSDTKEVASDDQSGRQYFTISKSSSHDDRANVETPRILGARHNSVTSLPNTKEVGSDEPGNRYFASDEPGNRYLASNEPGNRYLASDEPRNRYLASDEPGNLYLASDELENRYIASDEPGKRNLASDEPENRYFTISKSGELGHRYESPIAHKFSSSQMWQPAVHEFEVTPRKLWASRHNGVISLSNTDEANSGGSEHQYSPILTSSAHTHRVLQTRSQQGRWSCLGGQTGNKARMNRFWAKLVGVSPRLSGWTRGPYMVNYVPTSDIIKSKF